MPKQELEYLILVLNDYIQSLPMGSKIAVGERVQHCVSAIEQALQSLDAPKVPEGETVVGQ